MSKPLVLVVEDHRDIQEILADVFRMSGMEVRTTGRGDEALNLLHQTTPDCVLLDVDLPGALSGLDVLKRIRADSELKDIIVILLTAQNVAARTPEAEAADLVLLKPIEIDQVTRLVQRLLDSRPQGTSGDN